MLNQSCLLAGPGGSGKLFDDLSPGMRGGCADLATNAAISRRGSASGKTNQLTRKGHCDIFTG